MKKKLQPLEKNFKINILDCSLTGKITVFIPYASEPINHNSSKALTE